MFLFDPMYFVFVGPTLVIALWASWRVKSTFKRYAKVAVRSGMTGAEAAAAVARAGGASVTIERHPGFLSDHYDPRSKTLRLSPAVYEGRSVSAVAVNRPSATTSRTRSGPGSATPSPASSAPSGSERSTNPSAATTATTGASTRRT